MSIGGVVFDELEVSSVKLSVGVSEGVEGGTSVSSGSDSVEVGDISFKVEFSVGAGDGSSRDSKVGASGGVGSAGGGGGADCSALGVGSAGDVGASKAVTVAT